MEDLTPLRQAQDAARPPLGARRERGANDMDGYRAARGFLRDHPEWADVLVACYEEAGVTEEFAGAWVLERTGRWFPGLRMLVTAGVLERVRGSRAGRRAYYRMVDREGVGRVLGEVGLG